MKTLPNLYFLRIDNDYLEDAKAFNTKRGAVSYFRRTAQELAQYGQECFASIHIAPRLNDVVEYPDFILTLGVRGGVHIEKA
jgi:hypothetical protein